ncbi:M23 family metallopeptidase [Kribbia dieselivorans]|uniref:M23 family metallopeptidase n=1 Tax=Kribbia dieselivorans TaxID=331526 RepID=UPI0008387722|nr:M23 family metallopeptidase [Kribbia dieselivorans]
MPSSHEPQKTHSTARAAVAALAAVAVLTGGTLVATDTLSSAPAVAADDPSQQKKRADQRAESLRGDIHETSAALQRSQAALNRTRAKLPAARAKVTSARSAETAAAKRHTEAMAREAAAAEKAAEAAAALKVAQANEQRARDDIASTNTKISDTRDRVAGFAAQMYQEQGLGQLSVAMSAESPDDLATRLAMADTVMEVQNSAIGDLATTRANLVAKQDNLKALRGESEVAKTNADTAERAAEDAQVAAQDALAQAGVARRDAESAQAVLRGIENSQRNQAARFDRQKKAEEASLAKTEAWSNRLQGILEARALRARLRAERIASEKAARRAEQAAALAAAKAGASSNSGSSGGGGATQSAPSGNGVISAPSNGVVTSEFGPRLHPILNFWRLHSGRDYSAGCGAPVYAAASGTIVSAGVAGGYGNQLVIDHGVKRGVGLATTYNHLSSFVRTSGRVQRGELIAREGTTGMSTGCHLHFETRENGVPVDPRKWL